MDDVQTLPATTTVPKTSRFYLGKRERERLVKIFSYAILLGVAAIMLLPFFWMVSTSFKDNRGATSLPPKWMPAKVEEVPSTVFKPLLQGKFGDAREGANDLLVNYTNASKMMRPRLPRAVMNSTIIAITSTIGEILASTMAGFAFARLKFPGRKMFFSLILGTMMIPGIVTLIPSFILFKYLGWNNSWSPLIVPLLFGSAFAIFMCRQYFATLPEELEDAAKVDGANFFRIYWDIFLPQAKPVVATLFVLGVIARWNDLFGPTIYIQTTSRQTLTQAIASMNSLAENNPVETMAGSTMALLPILILFFFLQRFFIESVALTGIKG